MAFLISAFELRKLYEGFFSQFYTSLQPQRSIYQNILKSIKQLSCSYEMGWISPKYFDKSFIMKFEYYKIETAKIW